MGSLLPGTFKAGLDSFLRDVSETSNLPSMTSRYLCHAKHNTAFVIANKNVGLRLRGVREVLFLPLPCCCVAQGQGSWGPLLGFMSRFGGDGLNCGCLWEF